ncbi:CDP-alcohol phosphatidyltransferase family protein [Candidatus Falkowbacteria bacterium]|nr:CDP-alcohol phosphatidyltransferase family protein [Candidatus Falkowbacteria bacterium]
MTITTSRDSHHRKFQVADKIYFHDRLLAKTFLRLFPARVIPNHLTAFRFVATPVVALLMWYEYYYVGLIAFLAVAFSDVLDGSMARTRNQITEWGKIYDPLADKVLIASMVFIIVLRYVDFWTAIIIVALETMIIAAAWIRKREGRIVQANRWGKIKMFLQVAGVSILLLSIIFNWAALLPFASGTLYLAIAFAVVSLLTYGI